MSRQPPASKGKKTDTHLAIRELGSTGLNRENARDKSECPVNVLFKYYLRRSKYSVLQRVRKLFYPTVQGIGATVNAGFLASCPCYTPSLYFG